MQIFVIKNGDDEIEGHFSSLEKAQEALDKYKREYFIYLRIEEKFLNIRKKYVNGIIDQNQYDMEISLIDKDPDVVIYRQFKDTCYPTNPKFLKIEECKLDQLICYK